MYLGGIFRLCKLLPPVRLHGPILGSVVRAESWRGTNDNMITCAALRDGLPHAKPASLARQKGYTHPKIVCELNKTNRYLCSFEVGVTGTSQFPYPHPARSQKSKSVKPNTIGLLPRSWGTMHIHGGGSPKLEKLPGVASVQNIGDARK